MTLSLNDIALLNSIDLNTFEIRGAKSGINNARTTGPVYVDGTYTPSRNIIYGSGLFTAGDTTVTDLFFDAPYAFFDASTLRFNDIAVADSTYLVQGAIDSTSFGLDKIASVSGPLPITFTLGQREYVVQPDVDHNTFTGTALFTTDSTVVYGISTTWQTSTTGEDLTIGDFIKQYHYQTFYKVKQVVSNTELHLYLPFKGATGTDFFIAKRWMIGRTKIEYAKDDGIAFDTKSAMWTFDGIYTNQRPTGTDYTSLEDSTGILLKFSHTVSSTAPDLMDVATVNKVTFAQQTQYETPQFSLPKVPNPEDTIELYLNGSTTPLDRYPDGNQDYILNYTQNPIYTLPPPSTERKVCNVMFLKGISNVTLPLSVTETGQFRFVDSSGNDVTEILAGSERLKIDGVDQTRYQDYMIDQYSGLTIASDSTIREPLVKYVGVNYASSIDYGFSVYLDSIKQQISFPAQTSDDILFQPLTGRIKPRNLDHPEPGQMYEIHYMVDSVPISDELSVGTSGQTVVQSQAYPIKQQSLLVFKDGDIVNENEDYIVSYLTGRITFLTSFTGSESIVLNYTPLSLQVNGISYEDNTWYCTVFDSRLIIKGATGFVFGLTNTNLSTADATILRMYNETRDGNYDLTGVLTEDNLIQLAPNVTNIGIGLASTDLVLIDYKFPNPATEYSPASINYLHVVADTTNFYVEGTDIAQYAPSGSIVGLGLPDSATQYFFQADATYDGYGTLFTTYTPIPEDIVDPLLIVSDASVSFYPVGHPISKATSGSTTLTFPSTNIRDIFRTGVILKVNTDLYQVSSASHSVPQDSSIGSTIVSLTSPIFKDYTSSSDVSGVLYSDCPIYAEGTTEVFPRNSAVTLFDQPAFIISNNNLNIIEVIAGDGALSIDGTSFSYSTLPTLGDMSSAIDSSHIQAVTVKTYVPEWQSNKIKSTTASVYMDSSTVLSASPTLWYKGSTDTTDYSLSSGSVVLSYPLQRYDRYDLDYLGQIFLGDQLVSFSTRYFVNLPVKSKVQASFQYDNLDQFYIQVLSQKSFFETVSVPRMKEEAYQLSGNPGQGGEVSSDSNVGASEGGIANDVYRQKDAQIETRVFKNIYDFFQDRLVAFGDEVFAAQGYRLFNNDGTFSEIQQLNATKVVNRIFPFTDYTNNEPYKINPIAGYFRSTWAFFTKNSTEVRGFNTSWLGDGTNGQLEKDGFIGRPNSTRYRITQVVSDTSVSITPAFSEASTHHWYGEAYDGAKSFPIYDDDGYIGPKIVGTKSSNFGLSEGDDFTCSINDVIMSTTFHEPPFFPIPPILFLKIMFPLSRMTDEQVANQLMGDIPGLVVTTETVLDPDQSFGYTTALVLRTDSTTVQRKTLTLVGGSAVTKLGFNIGDDATGNLDPTVYRPEVYVDGLELALVKAELPYLDSIILNGSLNKLDRTSSYNLAMADSIRALATQEMPINTEERRKLYDQSSALGIILQEPSLSSYGTSLQAYGDAMTMLIKDASAYNTDSALSYNWQGKLLDWAWILDFSNTFQNIRGINTISGVGTDTSTGTDINPIDGTNTFILEVPGDNDRVFLDDYIGTNYFTPILLYDDTLDYVPGDWTGWRADSPTNWWRGAAYGNSLYVVVGDGGKIQTSSDTTTWTSRTPPTTNNLYAITWTGSRFTAVGQFGIIITSLDGISWVRATSVPLLPDLYDVISVGSTLIAVGNGYLMTSVDSMIWTLRSITTISGVLYGVAYNGSKYLTLGSSSTFTSTDSTTWIAATTSPNSHAVTAVDSTFITVGSGGIIRQSTDDGVTWKDQTSHTTEDLTRIIWRNNVTDAKMVAVGDNGTIIMPVDASAWGAQYANTSKNLTGLWGIGNRYIASGDYGTILTSSDATTWINRAPATSGYSVNNQIRFTADSTTPYFSIQMYSPAPAPTYTTGGLDITFDWTQYGSQSVTYPYSSHSTLADLVTAIDEYPGFGVTLINYDATYTYNNLQVATGPLPDTIYTGSDSSAFGLYYSSTYMVDSTTGVYLNGNPYPFASYTTIGDMASAIGSSGNYTIVSSFAPEYVYGSLRDGSGDVSTTIPGTKFYFQTPPMALGIQFRNPQCEVTATDVVLTWENKALPVTTLSFASYTTLVDMVIAINGVLGFQAAAQDAGSSSDLVVMAPTSIPADSPVTLYLAGSAPGIIISNVASDPQYLASATDLSLSFYNKASSVNYYVNYASYGTLQTFIDAISLLPGFDASAIYSNASVYPFDALTPSYGSISQIFYTPFALSSNSLAIEFTDSIPQYETDSTALVIIDSPSITPKEEFLYSSYPTLTSLKTGIESVVLNRVKVTGYFNLSTTYGSLGTIGLTILPITPPGDTIYFNSLPLFSVFFEQSNPRYVTDSTGLNLIWEENSVTDMTSLLYADHTSILAMKIAIQNVPGFDAVGDSIYDSTKSRAFLLASGYITGTDATMYPGLRPCRAYYQTISDQQLNNRYEFDTSRIQDLADRTDYLNLTRFPGIKSSLMDEGLLMMSDGAPGDIYTWANARFNRRQGCSAKLNQINQQIASNQSALQVNQNFL